MRKRFFVKPRLQLFHLGWLLGLIFIATSTGYVLFESLLKTSLAGEVSPESWAGLLVQLRWGFVLILAIMLLGVGLESVFFFHRIVGPIFALEKGLKRLTRGDFREPIHTREHDELTDVIHTFEEVKKELWVRMETSQKVAFLLSKELDLVLKNPTQENIAGLQAKLKEIKEQVVKQAA